jgi:hypothetical protein
VDGPPLPGLAVRGEPLAPDTAHDNEQNEIRRYRAKPDVKSPVWRQEGDDRIDYVRPLRENLGHDVDDQESQRAERDGAVHSLGHHPVSRGHDDPVRGQQADGHRGGQPDEREDPGVVEHEMLRSSIDVLPWLRHDQREGDHDRSGDQRCHDLRQVLANRSLRPRTQTLTAA